MFRKCISVLSVFVLINTFVSSDAKPQLDTVGSLEEGWDTVGSILHILPSDGKLLSRVLDLIAKKWDAVGSELGIGSKNSPAVIYCTDGGCSKSAPSALKSRQSILELLDREWDTVSYILDVLLSDPELQSRVVELIEQNWDEVKHLLFQGATDSDGAEVPVAYADPLSIADPATDADSAADADPVANANSSA